MTGANYHHSWSSLMAVAKVSYKHRGWKQNKIVKESKYDQIKNRRANNLTPASVVDSLSETVSMSKQASKSFVQCFKWTERHRHATVCITLQNKRWHPHPSIILGLTKVLSACVLPFMSEIWWWTWSCYPYLKDLGACVDTPCFCSGHFCVHINTLGRTVWLLGLYQHTLLISLQAIRWL